MNRLEQIENACAAVGENRVTPNWGKVFLSVERTRDLVAVARALKRLVVSLDRTLPYFGALTDARDALAGLEKEDEEP